MSGTMTRPADIRALQIENENLKLRVELAEAKAQLSEAKVRVPLVNQKLTKVMAQIPAITKRKASGISYAFRGVDEVYNTLHPLMKAEGLIMAPVEQREIERSQYMTKGGATMFTISGICKYRVMAEDGSFVEIEVTSTGQSPSEKAPLNMMSAAHKYALLQIFMIPTQESAALTKEAVAPRQEKTEAQILAQEAREREMQEAMQQARESLLATEGPEEFLAVLQKRVPAATLNHPKWSDSFSHDSALSERFKEAVDHIREPFIDATGKADWMDALKQFGGIFQYRMIAEAFKLDKEIQEIKNQIFQ